MRKKIFIINTITFLFCVAYTTEGLSSGFQSGFYTTLGGGYAALTSSSLIASSGTANPVRARKDLGKSGAIGRIGLGYDYYTTQGLLFGLDLSAALSDVSVSDDFSLLIRDDVRTGLKLKNTFDCALKFGSVFKNSFTVFVKTGLALTKFNLKSGRFFSPGAMDFEAASITKRKPGFLIGLGLDLPCNHSFSFGLGVNYYHFGNISITQNDRVTVGNRLRTKIEPRMVSIEANMKYSF